MDNYEWRLTNQFKPVTKKINFLQLLKTLIFLYKIKRKKDAKGVGGLLTMMRKEKIKILHLNSAESSRYAVDSLLSSIFIAEKFFTRQFYCLEISTALFLLLLKNKITAEFVIGVQKYDFIAHAWVEIENVVCGDVQSLKTNLAEIIRV